MIKITGVEVTCDGKDCKSLAETIEFVESIPAIQFCEITVTAYVRKILTGWAIWPGGTFCPECKRKQ